jgi:hypothetical protein
LVTRTKSKYGKDKLCKTCNNEIMQSYRVKNADMLKEIRLHNYKSNCDYYRRLAKKYYTNNKDNYAYKAKRKLYDDTQRNILTNKYIKRVIVGKTVIKFSEIPTQLLELKKAQILLQRAISNQKKREQYVSN